MRRISDPTQYEFLQHLQPTEPVHDLSAPSCSAPPRSSSSSTSSAACRRAEGGPTTRGTRTRWSGQAASPPPHGNFAHDPDRLPRAVRVQRPGDGRGLPAADAGARARARARSRTLSAATDGRRRNGRRRPHRLAVLTAGRPACLIVAGGLVTNTGAALAVPDWPTTFGHNMFLFPWSGMVGGVFWSSTVTGSSAPWSGC